MASGDKFYLADKPTLDEVKGKIGSTTDTGGSSTGGSIFGKLNYLVSQVSSYLSNIYNRIGSQSDTANSSASSTTHAKLNWFLNLFGKTDDTGGSTTAGSVMGKINKIISFESDDGSAVYLDERYYPKMMKKTMKLVSEDLEGYTHSIFVSNNIAYYSSINGKKVIAMDADTLRILGETAVQEEQSWAIFVADNILYYAFYKAPGGKIVSFDATTLQKKAETTEAIGAIWESCIFAKNGRLYASDNMTKKLLAFDAVTLEKIGESEVQAGYAMSLWVENNLVYYADSTAKRIIAFDAITLEQKGYTVTQAGNAQRITANSDTVFYADNTSRKIIAFHATALSKKGETIAVGGTASFQIALNGKLLYCYSSGSPYIPVHVFDANTLQLLRKITDCTYAYDIFAANVGLYVGNSHSMDAYMDIYELNHYQKGVIE